MKKIAAVGFCCMDIYEEQNKSYPTGNGINVIVNLRKRGISASAICGIGTDAYGQMMLDMLSGRGVDVSHSIPQQGETSRFYMRLTPDGDRIHIKNIAGVMDDFQLNQADIAFIQKHEYMHTDLFGRVLSDLPRLRAKGTKIVFDYSQFANDENMSQLLPYIDYAFFSAEEFNDDDAKAFLARAKGYGGQIVTATFGDKGSMSYDGTAFYRHGIVKTPIVNTVGAGDAYISGYLYGLMNKKPISDCMAIGAKAAAEIVAKFEPY